MQRKMLMYISTGNLFTAEIQHFVLLIIAPSYFTLVLELIIVCAVSTGTSTGNFTVSLQWLNPNECTVQIAVE